MTDAERHGRAIMIRPRASIGTRVNEMPAAEPATVPALAPFALAEALDHCAKYWWGASLASKILGFVTGASINLLPPEPVPFLVAACAIVAELCLYRSDAVKSTAQQFRRKVDLQDGLGWQFPKPRTLRSPGALSIVRQETGTKAVDDGTRTSRAQFLPDRCGP